MELCCLLADTDDEGEEQEEYDRWKIRELKRIKRDKEMREVCLAARMPPTQWHTRASALCRVALARAAAPDVSPCCASPIRPQSAMCARTHTHMCVRGACVRAHARACVRAFVRAFVHAFVHACVRSCARARSLVLGSAARRAYALNGLCHRRSRLRSGRRCAGAT